MLVIGTRIQKRDVCKEGTKEQMDLSPAAVQKLERPSSRNLTYTLILKEKKYTLWIPKMSDIPLAGFSSVNLTENRKQYGQHTLLL